jgi:alanine racemase
MTLTFPVNANPACARAWLTLRESALVHNIHQIRARLSPQTELMAIVKADAYGHGAIAVSLRALAEGVTCLGVATLPEGIQLRQAGISVPILILGAVYDPEEIDAIALWQLQPTLCSPEQALLFAQSLQRPITVHLNIDTGMGRLGPLWPQGEAFIRFVMDLPNLQIGGIYSHFATADDPNPGFMQLQAQRFDELVQRSRLLGLDGVKFHLANSAGTFADRLFHYDLVRVGLSLYGLYPGPQFYGVALKPVMAIQARITQIKSVPAGMGISYNHRYITRTPSQIAVVGIGYADGVPRRLSNQMEVLVQGQRVPQVGTITMDQIMIDVTTVQANVGDVVTLIGSDGVEATGFTQPQEITIEEWAEALGTISYEIACGFNQRLPKIVI